MPCSEPFVIEGGVAPAIAAHGGTCFAWCRITRSSVRIAKGWRHFQLAVFGHCEQDEAHDAGDNAPDRNAYECERNQGRPKVLRQLTCHLVIQG